MNRLLGIALLAVAVLFAPVHAYAQLTAAPNCPVPPAYPELPTACTVDPAPLDDNHRWAAAKTCLNALVDMYPHYFPGAVIGYQKDTQAAPLLYATGSGDTGFENNQTSRIVSMASVTKPITYVAALKMIQDHMNSADCTILADGTRKSTCIFPNGLDSRLNIALLRLDIRNNTDVYGTWFNNDYLGLSAAAKTEMDNWKYSDLRIRHLFTMTSGYPDFTFAGHKFCDGPNCAAANEVVCPTNATSGECYYSRLWNNYLNNRGTVAPLPEDCKPRPLAGARLFDFVNYYGGQVYNPTRVAQKYDKRIVAEPGLTDECILHEYPDGRQQWFTGRRATIPQQAKFYLGAPLQHRPGTEGRYSQQNLILVAYLIQAVTGVPFNTYAKREILAPLGLTDTFYVADTTRPAYAPGGVLHFVVHGSTNPNDHTNDEGGTPAQASRMVDLKRVPRNRNWVVPTIAPPLAPNFIFGTDKNWDEARADWHMAWPEGGLYSTATDMLKFLKFLDTGKTPGGQTLLDATYLGKVKEVDPVSGRTYAFNTNANFPNTLRSNGAWSTFMVRDEATGVSYTVFPQIIIEPPNGGGYAAANCEIQYGGVLYLRSGITNILEAIGDPVTP